MSDEARRAVDDAFRWPIRVAMMFAVGCAVGLCVLRLWGARLVDDVAKPAPPPLTSAQVEAVRQIAWETLRDAPVNHVHTESGRCVGQGCGVPDDAVESCVPPAPPEEWADGGYEKQLAEKALGL